ncbi:MAG: hypothetical protein LBF89_09350 [Bacteroidales bacterium]|nr:hypothetical protein [Bacteroidales bacterium]
MILIYVTVNESSYIIARQGNNINRKKYARFSLFPVRGFIKAVNALTLNEARRQMLFSIDINAPMCNAQNFSAYGITVVICQLRGNETGSNPENGKR